MREKKRRVRRMSRRRKDCVLSTLHVSTPHSSLPAAGRVEDVAARRPTRSVEGAELLDAGWLSFNSFIPVLLLR